MSVLIGFSVAISSSFANDFGAAYGFSAFQSGMCFIGSLLGGILGSKQTQPHFQSPTMTDSMPVL